MKKYLIATGLILFTGTAFAQQYDGPNKNEREAWAAHLKQQEALQIEQAKAAAAAEAPVVTPSEKQTAKVAVEVTKVEAVSSTAVKDNPAPAITPYPAVVAKPAVVMPAQAMTPYQEAASSAPNSTPRIMGYEKAQQPAAMSADPAKEAEIRERIKVATSNGAPGKR